MLFVGTQWYAQKIQQYQYQYSTRANLGAAHTITLIISLVITYPQCRRSYVRPVLFHRNPKKRSGTPTALSMLEKSSKQTMIWDCCRFRRPNRVARSGIQRTKRVESLWHGAWAPLCHATQTAPGPAPRCLRSLASGTI